MKISTIIENLFAIEKELNLFNQQIQGIYFWKLVRFEVYQKILREKKLITIVSRKKTSNFKKIIRLINIFKNSFYYPVANRKVDIVILENSRKILDKDGHYYDLYTKYYVDRLLDNSANLEIIDIGLNGIHYEKTSEIKRYADNIYYDFFKRLLLKKIKFHDNELDKISDIELRIENFLDIKVNLKVEIKIALKKFKIDYKKFNRLFKQKQNKLLYLVCSYGKEGIIQAAKDLNVEVIEFQHGAMNRYHAGYSFPYNSTVPYFPDKLYLFGEFWRDSTPLPLIKSAIKFTGFKDLNQKITLYGNIEKNKKITFISQWTIGYQIFEKAIEIAKNYSDYNVIFRLHPAEKELKEKYIYEIEKHECFNLKLGKAEKSISAELADSEFVIGVYSTAIYEALSLNCKVVLLNLYGIEFMDYLIKNNYVKKLDLNEKINLDNIDLKSIDSEYFFGESND